MLYHCTRAEYAKRYQIFGFRDFYFSQVSRQSGVWCIDRPLSSRDGYEHALDACFAIDIPRAAIPEHAEIALDAEGTHYLIPAAILNRYPRALLSIAERNDAVTIWHDPRRAESEG